MTKETSANRLQGKIIKQTPDNYLVVEGQRFKLTMKQLESLNINARPTYKFVESKTFVDDAVKSKSVFTISETGTICNKRSASTIEALKEKTLNFSSKKKAMEMNLRMELTRKLIKYEENYTYDKRMNPYAKNKLFYYITKDERTKNFVVRSSKIYDNGITVYFKTKTAARYAIEDVVKPFIAKHKNDFVW